MKKRARGRVIPFAIGAAIEVALCGLAIAACSTDDSAVPGPKAPDPSTLGPATDAASTLDAQGSDSQVNGVDASAPDTTSDSSAFLEAQLTVVLSLNTVDAGIPDTGNDAGDGGDGADVAPLTATKLTITAREGVTPVVTDLWLYTLDANLQMTPLTGFTSTAARKSPRLMLPATISGKPSGLAPADDGNLNGVMTNTSRGSLEQGAFVSAVNGTVVVTLPSAPISPILVIAGVEDQRYAGAAVINGDGTSGTVPAGVGVPEMHMRRSFDTDVATILKARCIACHNPSGPDNAGFYLVTGTRDDLVNDNFALKEGTLKCQTANPGGGAALASCIQAITGAEYLIEPGAPAVSDLLQRARPDEDGGTSALGLVWYGGKGSRYNATYGDRRMPSTTQSLDAGDWTNLPTDFDMSPLEFQVLFDWVAQGAPP